MMSETSLEERQPSLSLAAMLWYSVANLGYGAFYSINNALIAPYVAHFTRNAIIQGLMGSTHSVEGAIIQPVVGSLSDRTRTPIGRRRPFLLLFTPASALLLAFTPSVAHLPPTHRLIGVIAAIFLFTVLFNIAFDPYQALMPDITPAPQRSRVTAVWTFVGVLGQAGILLAFYQYKLTIAAIFRLTALLMVVCMAFTCALTREPHARVLERRAPWLEHLGIALGGLRTLRQAALLLGVMFVAGLGIGALLPFLTLFVVTITHCSIQKAAISFMLLMLATAAGALPSGPLSDRLGPHRVLMAGMGLILAACLAALTIHTLPQAMAVMVVAGLGNGAMSVSSYPLLTLVVPVEEVGFYTGLQTTAASIAQPLTVTATGLLINHGTLRIIFVVGAVCLAGAMALLSGFKPAAGEAQIQARRAIRLEGGW